MMIADITKSFCPEVFGGGVIAMEPMHIDDALLDALGDRWPFIEPDFPGQTFEAWLLVRLRDYNRFGYPRRFNARLDPPTLWDLVKSMPPADFSDYVTRKSKDLRAIGGTFVQCVRDLTPLATLMLLIGV